MPKDYQVRVEWEQDGEEEVFNFTRLTAARKFFAERIASIQDTNPSEDVHVELIEVLEQECVEGETNFSDDL